MGTRDHSDKTPKGGKTAKDMRKGAGKPEPAKVPLTQKTKYEDLEQVVAHNPLSGKLKTA